MSSKISTEKYDVMRLEKIKHHLETQHEKGKPRYFEIFIDNLKVVDKTNDIDSFDDYLMYMDEKTKLVKLLLYSPCEASPRNDKFFFSIESEEDRSSLGALEVQNKISSAIQSERERMKTEQLETDLKTLTQEMEEAQEYIEELETQIESIKATKIDNSKELKLGAVAGIAIEQILKRNPNILGKIPLLGLLSGTEDDNIQIPPVSSTSKVKSSFESEEQEPSGLELEMIKIFTEEEFNQVLQIIKFLGANKTQISTIIDLVKTEK